MIIKGEGGRYGILREAEGAPWRIEERVAQLFVPAQGE